MALIDRPGGETVVCYPEVTVTDSDGNTLTRASSTGITVTGCSVQPRQNSEDDEIGFTTAQTYRLRLPRTSNIVLGSQSKVSWNGTTYSVVGDAVVSSGSIRTRRTEYTLKVK